MPVEAKRLQRMPSRPLDLPPPFRLVTLREVGDAFEHAMKIAPEEGAGTLVYVGRFDLAEFAVVLEPDEPLKIARRAFYAGMTALIEALIAFAPPERPIGFVWPDAILVDGGLVGGGRLGWPADANEDEPPDWLVFGAMIRIVAMGESSAGIVPLGAALESEGFDGFESARLVESFARHLMLHLDAWRESGFEDVTRAYLSRLPGERDVVRQIDARGDLVVRHTAQTKARTERQGLQVRLGNPSWLDPIAGGIRNDVG